MSDMFATICQSLISTSALHAGLVHMSIVWTISQARTQARVGVPRDICGEMCGGPWQGGKV